MRSALFLQEMGIGVQWKLRHAAELAQEAGTEAPDPFVAAVQAIADGEQPDAAPVPPRAAADHGGPAAPAVAPARPPAPPVTPAAARADAAPAVSRPPAAAASPAAEGESTAWFDDAPTPPSSAPPLKSQAPNMNPARASAKPAPAARGTPDAPPEEDTSWFDDAPAPARPEPVSDEAIAAMDWAALKEAVSTCTRCPLCETRRTAINGRGAGDAKWIAIAAAPSRQDEKDSQAIAAEAGQLLNNMLKAIELKPDTDVYITNLVKCRPSTPDGADRAPSGEELLACRPYLERELALTGAAMAMTFGQHAARGLMLGPASRGKVMHYGAAGLPVVATYHPDDLLRKPEDKAKAWGDLCLAKASYHG